MNHEKNTCKTYILEVVFLLYHRTLPTIYYLLKNNSLLFIPFYLPLMVFNAKTMLIRKKRYLKYSKIFVMLKREFNEGYTVHVYHKQTLLGNTAIWPNATCDYY